MTVSTQLRRRVTQLRREYPFPLPISTTVAIVRRETKDWSDSEYPFLANLGNYGDTATGEVGKFEVTVKIVSDDDSCIGDDDVTGTFSDDIDKPENAIRCNYAGYNGPRGVRWYIPSNSTLELTDYYVKEGRYSRAQIDEIVRASIQRDMRDDAERFYYGVIATVSLDGEEVGESSLWGIDSLGDASSAGYMREVAEDMINDALQQARTALPTVLAKATAHADNIRSVIDSEDA